MAELVNQFAAWFEVALLWKGARDSLHTTHINAWVGIFLCGFSGLSKRFYEFLHRNQLVVGGVGTCCLRRSW